MGLENSSLTETIIRHFKNSELSATHSWLFLIISNNRLRCKGKRGRLSARAEGWALDGKG